MREDGTHVPSVPGVRGPRSQRAPGVTVRVEPSGPVCSRGKGAPRGQASPSEALGRNESGLGFLFPWLVPPSSVFVTEAGRLTLSARGAGRGSEGGRWGMATCLNKCGVSSALRQEELGGGFPGPRSQSRGPPPSESLRVLHRGAAWRARVPSLEARSPTCYKDSAG